MSSVSPTVLRSELLTRYPLSGSNRDCTAFRAAPLPNWGKGTSKAGGQGFEPRLRASKAPVLPLDDPPMARRNAILRHAQGVAGEQGFEPRCPGSEPGILPLDDSPSCTSIAEEGIEPPTSWLWATRATNAPLRVVTAKRRQESNLRRRAYETR